MTRFVETRETATEVAGGSFELHRTNEKFPGDQLKNLPVHLKAFMTGGNNTVVSQLGSRVKSTPARGS